MLFGNDKLVAYKIIFMYRSRSRNVDTRERGNMKNQEIISKMTLEEKAAFLSGKG